MDHPQITDKPKPIDFGARIRKLRETIQSDTLVELLHKHAFGKVKLGPTELRAAEILLRKSLPDMARETAATTHLTPFSVRITEPRPWPEPAAKPGAPEPSLPARTPAHFAYSAQTPTDDRDGWPPRTQAQD